ncbi:MAG: glycosyltransferase 87 family protein [Alphaproteobacteria bacterium]|jgi:hypothetical protein|nr:glycosyltransferase 87 family protein [Alphaproteobacteria bacterium]
MVEPPRTQQRSHRRRDTGARASAVLISVLLALFYAWTVEIRTNQPYSTDFAKFHASARYFVQGGDIYAEVPWDAYGGLPEGFDSKRRSMPPNLNPPLQTLLFVPLAHASYASGFRLWSALSIVMAVIAVWVAARAVAIGGTVPRRTFLFGLALFVYFPTWVCIVFGQLGLLLLLLVALGWSAARRGRVWTAGLVLGLGLALKPFLGLFLVLFLLLRKWRLSLATLVAFLAFTGIGLVVMGLEPHLRYLEILGRVDWYFPRWNGSAMGFWTRIFGGGAFQPLVDMPGLAQVLGLASFGFGLVVLAVLARLLRDLGETTRLDLATALTLLLTMFMSPLGWIYPIFPR